MQASSSRRVVVLSLPEDDNVPRNEVKSDNNAESLPATASAEMRIVQLRCPSTQLAASYCIVKASKNGSATSSLAESAAATIFEVNRAEASSARRPRSWFIDDHVQSDGALTISTPVDPAFILLDILSSNRNAEERSKYSPFSQIIERSMASFPHYRHLINAFPESAMASLCDVNSDYGPDMLLVRLNEDKVMRWMGKKVAAIAQVLRGCDEIAMRARGSAAAPGYEALAIKDKNAKVDEGHIEKVACQVLFEYLSPEWQARLAEARKTSVSDIKSSEGGDIKGKENQATAASAVEKKTVGRVRSERRFQVHRRAVRKTAARGPDGVGGGGPNADQKRKKQSAVESRAVKRLKKVSTKGMSKLSAFFTKKK